MFWSSHYLIPIISGTIAALSLSAFLGGSAAILISAKNETFTTKQSAAAESHSLIHTNDFDSHRVMTDDGLTLTILHLVRGFDAPSPLINPPERHKKVVFLQHGLFDSSDAWLLNGPEHSLPYLLANAGYDVWLGNSRGNQYSPTDNDQFTWDDMASHDLPAFIKYIQEHTCVSKVALIGHSQGAAQILAGLIDGRVFPNDISAAILLGPTAYLKHQQSKLFGAMAAMRLDQAVRYLPKRIFTPTLDFLRKAVNTTGIPYGSSFSLMFGESNLLHGSHYASHFPSPTSSMNVAHWIQSARTGRFQRFSSPLGKDQTYDVNAIPKRSIKIATFVGTNDILADPEDVAVLNRQLRKNGNLASTLLFDGYAHMDFMWSLDAAKTIYPLAVKFLAKTA